METVRLGRSELIVSRTAFGALPIQRVSFAEADSLLRAAYEGGINYFDTARGYSDSEEKLGRSLSSVRDKVVISTKVHGADKAAVLDALEMSLKDLNTDYVDLLQLHNPPVLPDPNDEKSAYAALVEARQKGMARAIGITSHKLANALAAAESGLYDTIQYPLSAISDEKDLRLIDVCKAHDVGVIAMKALCGGLLTNARAAFTFLRQYENVVPIWGMQRRSELDEFLALEAAPPELDQAMLAEIAKDRAELSGQFCRGCGYCLPCPVEIPISMAARMSAVIRRLPAKRFIEKEWQERMARIDDCTECGQCRERCPYGLDIPPLLKKMYEDYKTFI